MHILSIWITWSLHMVQIVRFLPHLTIWRIPGTSTRNAHMVKMAQMFTEPEHLKHDDTRSRRRYPAGVAAGLAAAPGASTITRVAVPVKGSMLTVAPVASRTSSSPVAVIAFPVSSTSADIR